MRHILGLALTLIVSFVFGQAKDMGKIEILNTVVVKEKKHDAVRLQLRLSGFNRELDTMCFYSFSECVPSVVYVSDTVALRKFYKGSSAGLRYIIEDEQGQIIAARQDLPPSFKYAKDEIRYTSLIEQVNKKTLKLKRIKMDSEALHNYHLSKLIVSSDDTLVDVYPLLKSYHDLSPGKYMIYLFMLSMGVLPKLLQHLFFGM